MATWVARALLVVWPPVALPLPRRTETFDGAEAAVIENVEVGERLLVRRARLRGGPDAIAIWAPGVWLRSRRSLLSVVLDARPRLPVRVESSLILTKPSS